MADATDSKSVEGNFMWVRLPPAAPDDHIIEHMAFRTIGAPKMLIIFGEKEQTSDSAFFAVRQTSKSEVCDAGRRDGLKIR